MPNQKNSRFDHAYAIIRVDTFQLRPDPTWENLIAVPKIVRTEDEAQSETQRLNALNQSKGSYYFWQITRLGEDVPRQP